MKITTQLAASAVIIALAGLAWNHEAALGMAGLSAAPAETGRDAGRPRGPGGQGPASVIAEAATAAEAGDRLRTVGEAREIAFAEVTARSQGNLEELLVKPGEAVEAGEAVARLDDGSEKLAEQRARLELDRAESRLARAERLAASGSLPAAEAEAARHDAEAARIALAEATLALERRTVRAPVGGLAGLPYVNPGDFVSTQAPIMRIGDRSALDVEFHLSERHAPFLRPGHRVAVSPVSAPGLTFEGEIREIGGAVDPDSRTFPARARIANPDDALRAGMAFSVSVDLPGESYPAVSPLAVQWDASGAYVWLLDEGKARRADVRIVRRDASSVLVDGPVSAGDMVVTEGMMTLREGSEAEPVRQASGEAS